MGLLAQPIGSVLSSRTLVQIAFALGTLTTYGVQSQETLSDFLSCTGERANSQFCKAEREAIDLRAEFDAKNQIYTVGAQPACYVQGRSEIDNFAAEALERFQGQYYQEAAVAYRNALAALRAFEDQMEAETRRLKDAAQEAEASGVYDTARQLMNELECWTSNRAESEALLESLEGRQLAESTLITVDSLIANGEWDKARATLNSIEQAHRSSNWQRRAAQIDEYTKQQMLNQYIEKGLNAMGAGNVQDAKDAYSKALALDPDNEFVKGSLREINLQVQGQQLEALEETTEVAIQEGNWDEATKALKSQLPLAIDQQQVNRQLEEVQNWTQLDQRLDKLLLSPTSISQKENRDSAKEVLASAAAISYPDVIGIKVDKLRVLLTKWTTRVELVIESDDATDVRIQPGVRLGKFETRRLNVLPGTYKLMGRRYGFREEVQEVSIQPGQSAVTVTVKCHERF